MKHLDVGLAAAIKNQLTPERQAKLRELAKTGVAQLGQDTRKRLTERIERVKFGALALAGVMDHGLAWPSDRDPKPCPGRRTGPAVRPPEITAQKLKNCAVTAIRLVCISAHYLAFPPGKSGAGGLH